MTKPSSDFVSLNVNLTPDHIQALGAMVDLGTEDRREFLAKYARENDYTDQDIADGHYQADCADDAMTRLTDALSGKQTPADSTPDKVFLELDRSMAEAVIEAVNIATPLPHSSDKVIERAQAATTIITDALVD